MIGDTAELIAARDAGLDDLLERLAAIAPRRMHLQVAVIFGQLRPLQLVVAQRGEHLRTAEEMTPKIPPALDVARLAALGNGAFHRRRRSRLQHLEDDARRRRSDVRNLAKRSVRLQKRLDW